MIPAEIASLRALADAATPGPWRTVESEADIYTHGGLWSVLAGPAGLENSIAETHRSAANTAFIAAAREAVPALCDEVERLTGLAHQFHADMWKAERQRDEAREAHAALIKNYGDVMEERNAAFDKLREDGSK